MLQVLLSLSVDGIISRGSPMVYPSALELLDGQSLRTLIPASRSSGPTVARVNSAYVR